MNKIRLLINRSEFTKNVLTLMTGTTIAQAIPIAISPILTRIYAPEDFGVFALFMAITAILGSIANGRYELAILLPPKDEDAINIAALGLLIATFLSIFVLVVILIFHDVFLYLLNNKDISLWLYFIPIAVFFTGLFNILNYFNTRIKNYKDIAKANIYKSLILATMQLAVGVVYQGVAGLVSGALFSNIFANLKLLKNTIKNKKLVASISLKKIKPLAKRFINFPKFSMWAILANTLSLHLTNILISSFYNVSTLGFYSLVQRVVGMPSSLIGGSIGQVFFQQATIEKQQTGKAIKTFNSTIKKLILIGLPIFLVLFFIVEDLFAFVFSEKWRIAGEYAKIVMPLFFVRFTITPVSNINNIFEKQKLALSWQVGLMLISISVVYFSNFNDIAFLSLLKIFSVLITFYYIILFFILRRIAYRGRLI